MGEIQFGDPRLPERFWSKVRMNDETGCWEWVGAINKGGYSRFNWPTRKDAVYGHRLAYETLVGAIDDDRHLDHLCRIKRCVNPSHLEPVTCRINLLRGTGASAVNAVKTHCPAGHPYDAENTYTWTSERGVTMRQCRICRREHVRRSYQRRHAA